MIKYFRFQLCLASLLFVCQAGKAQVPKGFVDLKTYIPDLLIDLRYYGHHNFVGRPLPGYEVEKLYISQSAAKALQAAEKELQKENLGFKVFDAYRPQKTVDFFKVWASDLNDTTAKSTFYPNVNKADLFKLGYIAEKSGHSRGSTIDLTIIHRDTQQELDMGSPFDYFGEQSHHAYKDLSTVQKANRKKLKKLMEKHGFRAIEEEWWHYTLKKEPYPNRYFNFQIQ